MHFGNFLNQRNGCLGTKGGKAVTFGCKTNESDGRRQRARQRVCSIRLQIPSGVRIGGDDHRCVLNRWTRLIPLPLPLSRLRHVAANAPYELREECWWRQPEMTFVAPCL